MIASMPVRLVSLTIVAFVFIVGVRGIAAGFAAGGATHPAAANHETGERDTGVVAYVLDGDTVQVKLGDGREGRVRLLGVSAPEMSRPGKPGECYGEAATRHLAGLLPAGATVTLLSDPSQDAVDSYGRWLRYVDAGGVDVGARQIQSGAAAARESSTPVARHGAYADAQRDARRSGAGMWASCR